MLEAVRESVKTLCATMTWCKPDYDITHARNFISQSITDWSAGKEYSFAILDSENQSFLGSVGFTQINRIHNFANIGYWIRNGRTRNGIGSAAVHLAAVYGFEKLNFNRLELIISMENLASRRVAEKAGAHFVGVLQNRLILGGKVHDAALYSFACQDFNRPIHIPTIIP